jgi:hypothetical protein
VIGEHYRFTNGFTMAREPQKPFRWELRDADGQMIERDRYRHDLISRHDLEIAEHIEGGAA